MPISFLNRPIAHRAYHDINAGRQENSRAAIRAAVALGYGIEIDLQLSKDTQAMVFHDYDLLRLTGSSGKIQQCTLAELNALSLLHGDENVPRLSEVLDLIDGQVPLLVELKDQDGAMGSNTGALEKATADALKNYKGDAAVMSFNPHSVAAFAALNTGVPVGLTTEAFRKEDYPALSEATRNHLRNISDFERVGASFISHDAKDLHSPAVARLKAKNIPVFCWTIKSHDAEIQARNIADNITFEGYEA
jgi:glycerophosphoryl diester phosphodiesterase